MEADFRTRAGKHAAKPVSTARDPNASNDASSRCCSSGRQIGREGRIAKVIEIKHQNPRNAFPAERR
jgi:hypothetical protein